MSSLNDMSRKTGMPPAWIHAMYKRLDHLHAVIEQRLNEGKLVSYYVRERDGLLWLLDYAKIPYEVGLPRDVEQRYAREIRNMKRVAASERAALSPFGAEIIPAAEPVEPVLPMNRQREIVAAYRQGRSSEELAEYFGFSRRAIVNVLNDAGYGGAVAVDEGRREHGIDNP